MDPWGHALRLGTFRAVRLKKTHLLKTHIAIQISFTLNQKVSLHEEEMIKKNPWGQIHGDSAINNWSKKSRRWGKMGLYCRRILSSSSNRIVFSPWTGSRAGPRCWTAPAADGIAGSGVTTGGFCWYPRESETALCEELNCWRGMSSDFCATVGSCWYCTYLFKINEKKWNIISLRGLSKNVSLKSTWCKNLLLILRTAKWKTGKLETESGTRGARERRSILECFSKYAGHYHFLYC